MDLDLQIDDIEWSEEDAAFAGGYVDYYVDFSRQHAQDSPQARAWLDTEKDNLLGAAYQAFEGARPDSVCALAANLGPRVSRFLDTLAYHEDAQRLLKLAIQAAIQLNQAETEAIFHLHLGLACERRHQIAAAEAEYRAAFDLAHHLRNADVEANSLINLGRLHLRRDQAAVAVDHLKTALALARRDQETTCLVTCLCNLGEAYQQQKRYGDARAALDEALALARGAVSRRQEGEVLHALGNLSFIQQDWAGALVHYEAAVALIEARADRLALLNLHNDMGMAYLKTRQPDRARHHLEQARALQQRFGNRHNLGVINFNLAILYRDLGDLAAAGRLAREARDLFEGTSNETWAKQLLQQIETSIHLRQARHDWP